MACLIKTTTTTLGQISVEAIPPGCSAGGNDSDNSGSLDRNFVFHEARFRKPILTGLEVDKTFVCYVSMAIAAI